MILKIVFKVKLCDRTEIQSFFVIIFDDFSWLLKQRVFFVLGTVFQGFTWTYKKVGMISSKRRFFWQTWFCRLGDSLVFSLTKRPLSFSFLKKLFFFSRLLKQIQAKEGSFFQKGDRSRRFLIFF